MFIYISRVTLLSDLSNCLLRLVFTYRISSQFIADLLREITEEESDFWNTENFIHNLSPTVKPQGQRRWITIYENQTLPLWGGLGVEGDVITRGGTVEVHPLLSPNTYNGVGTPFDNSLNFTLKISLSDRETDLSLYCCGSCTKNSSQHVKLSFCR